MPSTNSSPKVSGAELDISSSSNLEGYPPQRHAGKVGYGPAYRVGPTIGEKVKGYKEQLKGHLTHNHALTEHGREMVSGELKRKEHEQDMNDTGPFSKPENKSGGSGTSGA